MKKTLSLLLALTMLLACLTACGGGSANQTPAPTGGQPATGAPATQNPGQDDPFADMKEITLTYSSTKNEKADAAQLAWLQSITDASGGKVKFDVYLSNSLVSSTRDLPDALATGVADIATLNMDNYTGMFPLNYNLLSIPFTGITNECRLDVMNYMYSKYPELEQEFTDNGLKLLGWSTTNGNNLGVKLGKEYTGIADLKNVKVSGSSSASVEILAAAGAVPVTVAFPEIYQSLEKNVINGFMNHSAPAFSMGFHEHVDNWIVFGEDSGLYFNLVAVCMGLDKYNELPDAVKALFEQAEPARAAAELETQLRFDAMLKQAMEDAGKHYVVLSEEQLAEWKPYVQPSVDKILADLEASHPGFGAMYADLCDYVANYGK